MRDDFDDEQYEQMKAQYKAQFEKMVPADNASAEMWCAFEDALFEFSEIL